MSIQAVITNLVLRYQFKRAGRGPLNVHKARHMVSKVAQRNPPTPKDIAHTPLAGRTGAGLCSAEWLSVANPQRTVLYFHGGGDFFFRLPPPRPPAPHAAGRPRPRGAPGPTPPPPQRRQGGPRGAGRGRAGRFGWPP